MRRTETGHIMKTEVSNITITTYRSSKRPELSTPHKDQAEAIAWADANPVVWNIVSKHSKSATFGPKSSDYFGWMRGEGGEIIRAAFFKRQTEETGIWGWRARFTLE